MFKMVATVFRLGGSRELLIELYTVYPLSVMKQRYAGLYAKYTLANRLSNVWARGILYSVSVLNGLIGKVLW